MTEAQRKDALAKVESLILRARKKEAEAKELTDKAFEVIQSLGFDPESIPSAAENAENLSDAICCFCSYNEYSIEGLMKEIEAAAPPADSPDDGSRQKTRVYVERCHLASIDRDLFLEFRHEFGIVNFVSWVKEQARKCYGIPLLDANAVDELKRAVRRDHYQNIGAWLSAIMCREMEKAREGEYG